MMEPFSTQNGNSSVQLLTVTPDQLQAFGESLIRRTFAILTKKDDEAYLKIAEVAKLLQVDRSTLYRWDKDNYLKPVRIGGKPRYRQSDIDKILKK